MTAYDMVPYGAQAYGGQAYNTSYQPGWNTGYGGAAGAVVPYNGPGYGNLQHYIAIGSQYRRPWAYGRQRSTIEFNDWDCNNPYFLLSNSAPLPMYDEQGRYYPTAAHLFYSRKFVDPQLAAQVAAAPTARAAKDLADSWRRYTRSDWRRVNVQIMEWVLREKLRQHPQFVQLLLSTGRAYLLNTSDDDVFWGFGSGRGRNELGRALMRLRKEL